MNDPASPFDSRRSFDAIEVERLQIGFSRAELTRAANVSEATYAALMREPGRTPRPNTVHKLRNALHRLAARAGLQTEAAE